ncbi:MAG: hypothetical protein IJK98_00500 [Clostridia bacterium]|nr:hypothetical protein [Clostridia bacterium]
MTMIEKLYYGHIHPREKLIDPESRFTVLQDLLSTSDEDLTRMLPENCKGAYDAFKAAYDEMYAMAEKEAFADGFSLGLRLGIESYGRETEFAKDGV